MTDRFLKAVEYTFKHEGGYNNIKEDSGGSTNFGISLSFLKILGKKGDLNNDGRVDWLDIKQLTKTEALEIYWDNFWRPLYDKVQSRVGIKLFDTTVNAGSSRSHKLLQIALNSLGEKLSVDGAIGSQTIAATLRYEENDVLRAYCKAQANFYEALVSQKPKNKIFLKGWLNRAAWLPK